MRRAFGMASEVIGGAAAGISVATVRRMEDGGRGSLYAAAPLGRLFGLEPEALLHGPDTPGENLSGPVNVRRFRMDRWLRLRMVQRHERIAGPR